MARASKSLSIGITASNLVWTKFMNDLLLAQMVDHTVTSARATVWRETSTKLAMGKPIALVNARDFRTPSAMTPLSVNFTACFCTSRASSSAVLRSFCSSFKHSFVFAASCRLAFLNAACVSVSLVCKEPTRSIKKPRWHSSRFSLHCSQPVRVALTPLPRTSSDCFGNSTMAMDSNDLLELWLSEFKSIVPSTRRSCPALSDSDCDSDGDGIGSLPSWPSPSPQSQPLSVDAEVEVDLFLKKPTLSLSEFVGASGFNLIRLLVCMLDLPWPQSQQDTGTLCKPLSRRLWISIDTKSIHCLSFSTSRDRIRKENKETPDGPEELHCRRSSCDNSYGLWNPMDIITVCHGRYLLIS